MAQWSRALAVLPQNPGLIRSIHMLTSSEGSDIFCPPRVLHKYMVQTTINGIKKKKIKGENKAKNPEESSNLQDVGV